MFIVLVYHLSNGITKTNRVMEKLPTVNQYREYLEIARFKFNLSIDECRNRFGLYTIAQWEQLLKKEQ